MRLQCHCIIHYMRRDGGWAACLPPYFPYIKCPPPNTTGHSATDLAGVLTAHLLWRCELWRYEAAPKNINIVRWDVSQEASLSDHCPPLGST
ncbi:hypothetical protein J6590_090710 [Homalodisca vitripennis]|nr:hypothetical protein J6590_090710 [Homalodisca vitripennis]